MNRHRHPHRVSVYPVPASFLGMTLLLGASPPLLADEPTPSARDWLAAPPTAQEIPPPSPREPRFELFPEAQGIGIPDENGISSGLLEAIRKESERALQPVSEDLSTQ